MLLSDKVGVTWYAGCPEFDPLSGYVEIIKKVVSDGGFKETVLVGHSSGGFAALVAGAQLENSLAIAVNAQVNVEIDWKWRTTVFQEALFPKCKSVAAMVDAYPERFDARELLKIRPDSSRFHYYVHEDDVSSRGECPQYEILSEFLGLEGDGVTARGDAMVTCRWESRSPHDMPGTALPVLEMSLGEKLTSPELIEFLTNPNAGKID